MSSSPKMSVCFFVFQVGKESGANVICRRRRNRRSTGRGKGKIGATLVGRVGTEQSTKNSPDHLRTDPAARGGELLSHATRKVIYFVVFWLAPGPGLRQI